jgi:hypothetical protein
MATRHGGRRAGPCTPIAGSDVSLCAVGRIDSECLCSSASVLPGELGVSASQPQTVAGR